MVESKQKDEQIESYSNLREWVHSAAIVVTSASTTLGDDHVRGFSITYGSDFGDILQPESSQSTLQWISSNTVHESEDELPQAAAVVTPRKRPARDSSSKPNSSWGNPEQTENSASENDLEAAKLQAFLKQGRQNVTAGDYGAAERLFSNCFTRISAVKTLTWWRHAEAHLYARRAHKGYKRLGPSGVDGVCPTKAYLLILSNK